MMTLSNNSCFNAVIHAVLLADSRQLGLFEKVYLTNQEFDGHCHPDPTVFSQFFSACPSDNMLSHAAIRANLDAPLGHPPSTLCLPRHVSRWRAGEGYQTGEML